jgi:hypothetical protein
VPFIIAAYPKAAAPLDELELGADLDAALEAARDGARARVEAVDALGLLATVLWDGQPVTHGDATDHQHLLVELDLADRLDVVALGIDFDLTRFQRAGEGAGQSPAGGGDDVVERRRVRRIVLRRDAVVLGDLGMHAECDRVVLGRQVRQPLRAAEALDPHA